MGGYDTVITEQTYKSQVPLIDLAAKPPVVAAGLQEELNAVEEELDIAKDEKPVYTVGTKVVHKTFGPGTIT
ncbi:MAG: hypothetical protein ACI4C3_04030, partial [Bacteroides sp.]